jgi:hypothetical protein
MSLNASGVRDTTRSLHISPNTLLRALKKKEAVLESVNTALLRTLDPAKVPVDIDRDGEAEMDERHDIVMGLSVTGMPLDGQCKCGHLHF